MQLYSIIKMLDDKEYKSIKSDEICNLTWFDVELNNGNIIRVEKCVGYKEEENHLMVLYIVPNEKTASEVWSASYGSNAYNIFNNIYNELERTFE